MDLKRLRYGYYKNYCSGDGSMYDHCTAYTRAKKHYTIFEEDSCNYYDILDENRPYNKNAEYGETLVTIENELLDVLPNCIIDSEREYTLEEILSLMPRVLVANLSQNKSSEMKKVL